MAYFIGKEATSEVESALESVSAKWKHIAIILGLPYNDLQKLHQNGDVEEFTHSVVEKWLSRDFDFSTFGMPSWKRLVEAIGSKAGGDNARHAHQIAKEHKV